MLSIQIDPYTVLGVAQSASLHEIREAYRRKVKLHHPDVGGEEWAFRILAQSYETLSTARVVKATENEFRVRPARESAATSRGTSESHATTSQRDETRASSSKSPGETIRPGVSDPSADPTRIVDVEQLWVRYEVDHLWLLQDGSREDRFLSCCLNVTWPEPSAPAAQIPDGDEILRKLSEAFEEVHIQTPVINSRCKIEDHKFQGWLSYPSTQLAWSAFNRLHESLNARGLSVKQWTRDLIIPREGR